MKLFEKDIKHRTFKIAIDDAEDLWYLSTIIEEGDLISGMTERKMRLGGSEEKSKVITRPVFLKINVEKISYDTSELRVLGPIIDGPQDVPRGDYHTCSLHEHITLTLEKKSLSVYILKKLEEALEPKKLDILVVAFDREEAIFALLKNNGYEILLGITGDVSKKDFEEKKTNFYKTIVMQIQEYDARYHFSSIILASPAFWKEYLMGEVRDDVLRKKITLAACSSVDNNAIHEILKRPELKTVLQRDRSARENALLEELLDAIRAENAAYGYGSVNEKLLAGNIRALLISENLIKKSRLDGSYASLEKLMNAAESIDADIRIIGSEDAAKRLDGLSGIAALLRWKEHY